MNEFVAILDFGGQYKQLIARRVRETVSMIRSRPHMTGSSLNSVFRCWEYAMGLS